MAGLAGGRSVPSGSGWYVAPRTMPSATISLPSEWPSSTMARTTAASLLPADDASYGFDNVADVLSMSQGLLDRYLHAARRISRLAVGDTAIRADITSYPVKASQLQDDRMSEELPFGSRAGVALHHQFPLDGEYVIKVALKRSVYEYIVNIDEPHDMDVRLDGTGVPRIAAAGSSVRIPSTPHAASRAISLDALTVTTADFTSTAHCAVTAGTYGTDFAGYERWDQGANETRNTGLVQQNGWVTVTCTDNQGHQASGTGSLN